MRDLLKSIDSQDAYNGTDCNSLSFLNVVTAGNILGNVSLSVKDFSYSINYKVDATLRRRNLEHCIMFSADKKSAVDNTVDCTPPDFIMPGSETRPILPLHPTSKEQKSPQCLKVLTYSGWNPPPGNRRMHGT